MNPPGNTVTEQITIDVHLPPGGPLSGMAAGLGGMIPGLPK